MGAFGLGTSRIGGMQTPRNAPSILNTAFNGIDIDGNFDPTLAPMFRDSRSTSLEEQALQPILSKIEMRGPNITEDSIMPTIIQRLDNIPQYKELFFTAFQEEEITQERILSAIAIFETTLVASNSQFDQFMQGNNDMLTQSEQNRMTAFIESGCADCHNGPMFSDFKLKVIGVPDGDAPTDQEAGSFNFKTPTLRNLALTAPYMHNGIFESLEEVLDFYRDITRNRRNNNDLNVNLTQDDLDPDILDLDTDRDTEDDIILFLNTLNDTDFDRSIPTSVPSNLPVGGQIE